MSPSRRPALDGIVVVALEHAVAGPFASRQLADLGANVVKVERPAGGDFARRYDEAVDGWSSYFVWLNRGKRSVALDLKTDAGVEHLRGLLGTADVFLSNLGPGALARLGLDAAALAADFPQLISCEITGFGTTGSWANRKAYDMIVQAETGLMGLTGSAAEPARTGISVADIAAGMYALSGVLAALVRRATTGVVEPVSVALFDALAEWLGAPMYYSAFGPGTPPRVGPHHATIAPYGSYVTGDGQSVVIAVQNDAEWRSFCAALDLAHLVDDDRLATNSGRVRHRDELSNVIEDRLRGLTAVELFARLAGARIAHGRMRDVGDLLTHPALVERGRWSTAEIGERTVPALRHPLDPGDRTGGLGRVPALGEDGEDEGSVEGVRPG
jgi:itaconate CoA-transferase